MKRPRENALARAEGARYNRVADMGIPDRGKDYSFR